MPAIITALDKRAMTQVVNRRELGKKALKSMLFPESRDLVLGSEYVHTDELTGQAGMAPFVEKNGKAIAVDQLNGQSYMLETPNINIKRPITCSAELLKRAPGQSVFVETGDDVYGQAMERQITEDLAHMEETIRNREEWMVSQLIQGEISYNIDGKAAFTITTSKPSGNTFTVTNLWDGSDPTPLNDIKKAKRVVQPYSGPGFQVAVCGENASDAISAMLEAGTITAIKTDSGIAAGMGDLIADYQANGMLYLGIYGGIPFFEYAGTYLDDDTEASTPFIRTDYVEFLQTARLDMDTMYYGAILDAEAILSGLNINKRFATSDLDKDAGTYVAYLKSRPFPWFLRPDWNVSMKVT
jgi:hypothetical protein